MLDTLWFLSQSPIRKNIIADKPGKIAKGRLITYLSIKVASTAITPATTNLYSVLQAITLYITLHQNKAKRNHIAPIGCTLPSIGEAWPEPEPYNAAITPP